ncbi:MAG: MEDS domain-containing protein [Candidatus Bathyarchaeota archaeon]|nr:MEDS domain-containing protein [Candidatus Bathyarchaeota archaeon]
MYSYVELDSFIREIGVNNHIILFYDSQESKRKVLYSYLADGLKKGMGIVYIRSEETEDQIRRGLVSQGIDFEPNLSTGNIVIRNYDEWYIENDHVEPMRIIDHWHKVKDQFTAKGLGVRATGELSCFFEHDKVRELLKYEYALHKVLNIPMDVICAYNLKTIVDKGYTEMIMPLVRAHGKALFTAEGGTMMLEPQGIEGSDLEKLMEIKF